MTHQVRTPTAGSVIFLPLSDENRILISQHLHGGNQVDKTFLAFSGRSILGPQKGRPSFYPGRAGTETCPYDEIGDKIPLTPFQGGIGNCTRP